MVVILNGASSAGKSSIATALQTVWPRTLLHAGIDLFTRMLPAALTGFDAAPGDRARHGFSWRTGREDGETVMRLEAGPEAERVMRDMRRTVAFMEGLGNDVVVDEILLRQEWLEDWRAVLQGRTLWLVGVRCPLEVLVARERERGRRILGQARGTFAAAHAHCRYDLEVDSGALSPIECARAIAARLAPAS